MGGQRLARDIRQALVDRGDPDYESARAAVLCDELTPPRHPEMIVRAASADDVREAIALACSRGLKVSVRAGGPGRYGAPLRDGGLLIDVSRLRRHSVADGSATVEPGVTGQDLIRALAAWEHAFPVAHRGPVPVGGFVMGG
ncbi:MAG TPA: FAD-dependent oxidoreductase, partial [Actinoallomurus sp.]|nr:FAD-dependent oxidoreductase [Actinoallomurus sp.]